MFNLFFIFVEVLIVRQDGKTRTHTDTYKVKEWET